MTAVRFKSSWALRLVVLGSAAATSLVSQADESAGPLYRLEARGWQPGCPTLDQLQQGIVSRLGRNPFSETAAQLVVVSIESGVKGLGGIVELRDSSQGLVGRRVIAPSRRGCGELSKALALVVTLALDENARVEESSAASTAQSRAGMGASALAIESSPPQPPARPWRGPRWTLALGAVGALGSGPGAAFGGLLALDARWAFWSVGLEGGGDGFVGANVSEGRVYGALASGTLSGCARPKLLGRQLLGGCGLFSAGAEQAGGSGYAGEHPSVGPYAAAGARLLAEVWLAERLALQAHADLLVPLIRARFSMGDEDLWQAPPLAGSLGVRLAFAL